jgi:vacuolar-type H+-ATPase subunit C/Vma6
MTSYTDLVARTRGLSTRLLPESALALAAQAKGLPALVAQLAAFHVVPPAVGSVPPDPRVLELAFRRRAGARLRVLERWAGPRVAQLSVLFDDEDRRSLRALLRGAAAGISPEARLTGLIPTSALPLRALDELSRLRDISALTALLLAWQHPFARAIADAVHGPQHDLFHLELALARAYAERAVRSAKGNDAALRHFVQRAIDIDNLWAALLLAERPMDVNVDEVFLDGGKIIGRSDLALALETHNQAAVAAQLGARVRATPLAAAIEPGTRDAEDAALHALIDEFARWTRREPLSLAPVVLFVLRQRAELQALARLVWSAVLGVPTDRVKRALGSAA